MLWKYPCQNNIFFIIFAAAGFDLRENIQPWQCSHRVLHYEFKDDGGTYNIRIRPKLFSNTSFPKFCQLTFTALVPWDDIMFSFSYCDNGVGDSCEGDSTKYSYIGEDSVTYILYDERNGKEVSDYNHTLIWDSIGGHPNHWGDHQCQSKC